MKLFLDTANIKEIEAAAKLGIICGVTTNPSLVSAEGTGNYKNTVQRIDNIYGVDHISAEVTSDKFPEMLEQAKDICQWSPSVVIKLPITLAGLEVATAIKRDQNYSEKINMTLCFSLNQALLAASVGADFVSPFVGRLDDIGDDGIALVKDIVDMYRRYGIKTKVIAASIRHTQHILLAAKAGADIATVPYKILMQTINHPLTDIGQTRFLADWQKITAPAVGSV